jgi:hypothetical protein
MLLRQKVCELLENEPMAFGKMRNRGEGDGFGGDDGFGEDGGMGKDDGRGRGDRIGEDGGRTTEIREG